MDQDYSHLSEGELQLHLMCMAFKKLPRNSLEFGFNKKMLLCFFAYQHKQLSQVEFPDIVDSILNLAFKCE